jgi:hypothetical protein
MTKRNVSAERNERLKRLRFTPNDIVRANVPSRAWKRRDWRSTAWKLPRLALLKSVPDRVLNPNEAKRQSLDETKNEKQAPTSFYTTATRKV